MSLAHVILTYVISCFISNQISQLLHFLLFNERVTLGVKWKELHAVEDEDGGEPRVRTYRTNTTCINKQFKIEVPARDSCTDEMEYK